MYRWLIRRMSSQLWTCRPTARSFYIEKRFRVILMKILGISRLQKVPLTGHGKTGIYGFSLKSDFSIASKEDAVGPSGLVGWLQPVARVHCARLSRGLMLVRAASPLPHQHE